MQFPLALRNSWLLLKMASLPWPNWRGYRGRLASSLASLSRSASGRICERWWEWLTSHATGLAGYQWRRMGGGQWGHGQPFRKNNGVEWNARSEEFRPWRGCFWHIIIYSTVPPPPDPPHPPTRGGPNLPSLFTETFVAALLTGKGLPGWGFKPEQPPG